MLVDFVVKWGGLAIIGFAAAFALAGLFIRKSPESARDRDNLVYADGFQGATIATLIVVAVVVYYIDDPRTAPMLKEQASLVAVYSVLGVLQQADRFRRKPPLPQRRHSRPPEIRHRSPSEG